MEFWKINGNGNDFITMDLRGQTWGDGDLADLARRLCRRRSSIGADGILVIQEVQGAYFKMRIFNSDGSEGEMCGNGARCVARFAYERAIAPAEMVFETLAGAVKASVQGRYVELDLGEVELQEDWLHRSMEIQDRSYRAFFATVGVPHLVLITQDELPDRESLRRIGRKLRYDEATFPLGTNVNFLRPLGRGEVEAVTYERGVEDLTDSCGTGSVASALGAHVVLSMASPVEVHNPGGTNWVAFQERGPLRFAVTLGGQTAVVAKGTVGDDA